MNEAPLNFRDQIPPSLVRLREGFTRSGYEIYAVGGAIRNLAMGLAPKDWDFCTNAQPEEVKKLFRRVLPTGIKHGTVTVLLDGEGYEVTTYRIDGAYQDGRHPDAVQYTRNLAEDLARRDFTMNAMAMDLGSGEVIDPFAGWEAIQSKTLATVGNPAERFQEDGLRIVRGIRFAAQFDLAIALPTRAGMVQAIGNLAGVSMERYRDELIKTIQAPGAAQGLVNYRDIGAFANFLPELVIGPSQTELGIPTAYRLCGNLPAADLELRLAGLFFGTSFDPSATKSILTRLKLPNKVVDTVVALVQHAASKIDGQASDAAIKKIMATLGSDLTHRLIVLQEKIAALSMSTDQSAITKAVLARIETFLAGSHPITLRDLAIDGSVLSKQLALAPSKQTGQILQALLEHVWEFPADNTVDHLVSLAKTLLKAS